MMKVIGLFFQQFGWFQVNAGKREQAQKGLSAQSVTHATHRCAVTRANCQSDMKLKLIRINSMTTQL